MDEGRSAADGYLILTRRTNETIRIGSDIVLRIISVGRNVRISIEAPADQRILRSELLERASPASAVNAPAQEEPPAQPVAAAEPALTYRSSAGDRRKPVIRYRRRHRMTTEGNES